MKFFQKLLINSLWEPTGEVDRGRRAGSSIWRGDLMAQSFVRPLLGHAIAPFFPVKIDFCTEWSLLFWLSSELDRESLMGEKDTFRLCCRGIMRSKTRFLSVLFLQLKWLCCRGIMRKSRFFPWGTPLWPHRFRPKISSILLWFSRCPILQWRYSMRIKRFWIPVEEY